MARALRVRRSLSNHHALGLLFGAALAFGTLTAAPSALAAPPTPQQKFEALRAAQEAAFLVKQGKLADAKTKLERAESLDPQPEYQVALAEVEIGLGHLVHARVLARTAAAATPATLVAKRAVERARDLGYELDERTPSVKVEVRQPANGKVRLELDGDPVTAGEPTPVDPGHHELSASAPGYAPLELDLDLKEADAKTVPVTLTPTAGSGAEPTTSSQGFDKAPAIVAWSVGGVALFVMGIGLGVHAMKSTQGVADRYNCGDDSVCHPPPELRAAFEDDLAEAQAFGNASTAGFVLAGVGAAAGTVLWVLSDRSQASSGSAGASGPALLPLVAPGYAGLAGRF